MLDKLHYINEIKLWFTVRPIFKFWSDLVNEPLAMTNKKPINKADLAKALEAGHRLKV